MSSSLTSILALAIALSGFPIGLLIARFTEEELESGRKWFKLLVMMTVIAIFTSFLLTSGQTLLLLISSFVFIMLLSLAALLYPKLKCKSKKSK